MMVVSQLVMSRKMWVSQTLRKLNFRGKSGMVVSFTCDIHVYVGHGDMTLIHFNILPVDTSSPQLITGISGTKAKLNPRKFPKDSSSQKYPRPISPKVSYTLWVLSCWHILVVICRLHILEHCVLTCSPSLRWSIVLSRDLFYLF